MDVIHPFPARMAPDIVRKAILPLPQGSKILDPMCGSGTVIRSAVLSGHAALGADVDPLAVMMSQVWSSRVESYRIPHDAEEIVRRAKTISDDVFPLPWQDGETVRFIKYWFAEPQKVALSKLAWCLHNCRLRTRKALLICLSRTIITKESAASLARDTSHSRPHKVATENNYDVFEGFIKAARSLAIKLSGNDSSPSVDLRVGDARRLHWIPAGSVDAIITSPPYLNAIDYLRGHRLALVWLGYSVKETRAIRSTSVGAERGSSVQSRDVSSFIASDSAGDLPDRQIGWIRRYVDDASSIVDEMTRVLREDGKIVLVIGNSYLRGSRIRNDDVFASLLTQAGASVETSERQIPARRRYLPPPNGTSPLAFRMRTETVLEARFK